METIGITCHCGNKHAIILSQRLVECTKCTTVHNIDDVKSYTSYDITPLHVIEQRAKKQAEIDMYDMLPHIDWDTCFLAEHEQFGVPF